MELIENKDNNSNIINSIDANSVTINNQSFTASCIVSNQHTMTEIGINNIDDLNAEIMDYLLSNNPEIIIIGSGSNHKFPDIKFLKPIAMNNIGFEVMNNQSATRTYNVLIAEERQVSCLLILE
jgi:uncharacterized protein